MLNPFNLNGPSFLALYIVLFLFATIATILYSWWIKSTVENRFELAPLPDLNAAEIAYLRDGRKALIDAEIAAMVHEGMLVADVTSKKLSLGLNTNATGSIQKAILQAVRNEPAGLSVKDLRKSLDETSDIDRAEERLVEQGLYYSREQQRSLRSFPSWLLGALFVFGLIKVFIGLDRDKPIAFLAIFSVVTFAMFFLLRKWMPTRTRRGDQALARMFDEYDALKATASTHTSALSSSDAMLALCLFGPALFSTGPVADYAMLSRPPREGGSGCGGSGCGSSSGCGGGDGGGGGGGDGGGGGCGGCGGGGD